MSLYFETKVHFNESGTITTICTWHEMVPLLAVGSYNQEKGGFVTIFDETGEPLPDITYPVHPVSQITSLVWHPEKKILVTGWENGEISIWHGSSAARNFINVNGPHTSPVTSLLFSEVGGRLVSGDSTGILVGWKYDATSFYLTAFHHDLKDPLTHITFRLSVLSKSSSELQHLARAAVNGDENALDALSSWRPRTNARTQVAPRTKDNTCFFVSTQSGLLYYVNQSGTCTEIMQMESPLNYMLYHPNKDELIIMNEGLTLEHYTVDSQGRLSELAKIKLSGRTQALRGTSSQGLVWVGGTSFAVLTGDMTVRVLDLETGDNYLLPTEQNSPASNLHTNTELFTSIAFCKFNRTLCAGTNLGQLHIWSCRNILSYSEFPESNWTLENISSIKGTVKEIVWGNVSYRNPYLCVNCVTNVFILKKQSLCSYYCENLCAIQLSSTQLLIQNKTNKVVQNYEIQVQVLCLSSNHIVVSNGRIVLVFQVVSSNKSITGSIEFKVLGNFTCESERLLIYEHIIIALMSNSVQTRSLNGVLLNTIKTSDIEGEPIGIELTNKFLCVFTMNGYLKLYDISPHEPKLLTNSKYLGDDLNDFGEIISAKSNCSGTAVAILVANSQLIPDGKLYSWDLETDILSVYDFLNESNANNVINLTDSAQTKCEAVLSRTIPVKFFWDSNDYRLLAVESKTLISDSTREPGKQNGYSANGATNKSDKNKDKSPGVYITCLFVTKFGFNVMYRCHYSSGYLMGLTAPNLIMHGLRTVTKVLVKHFEGLEECDEGIRTAVLDFAYYLCLGNMDQAFKAIHLVQSNAIWENLARMCVKTQRLDVALVCLGHMKNARAAKAVREAMNDRDLEQEAKTAMLAVQLGMHNEAKLLYEKCNRWDLLNKLYQAQGRFDDAIRIAKEEDRIHLKNTYYHFGKHQEKSGDLNKAIDLYYKANCKSEIPRLLLQHPLALQDYMEQTTDQDMLKWWAQYVESRGDIDRALKLYGKANDCVSQVRILCFMRLENSAAELAMSSNSKAACYELARHYEATENVEEAIQFFRRAQAFGMAMRLCREQNMDEILWGLALSATPAHKIEAAEYFETAGDMQKAISLYHRAGLLRKALELSFNSQQFDTLQDIAADLNKSSDPELVKECAEYFVNNEQYEKAVDLLAIANKYTEALDICAEHTVNISEELAEHLSPAKNSIDERERLSILYKLAEILHAQRNYHLATKKFTQAGDKIRAMKSLLKSGDTEKIIFFAGVSRQKEVYVMAANYLQALDWQSNPDILRNIVSFYAKGKAHDLLANFYVACAQVEIDDFKNYEKALSALGEAARCLSKVDHDPRPMEILTYRQTLVKRFLECQRTMDRDINTGIIQCRQLLRVDESENPVRKFDILSLLIEQGAKPGGDREIAIEALREIQRIQGGSVTRRIPREVLEKLGVEDIFKQDQDDENYEEEEEIQEVI